jgi:hypothetical protein
LAEFIHCQFPHIYKDLDRTSLCLKGGTDWLVWFDKHFPQGVTSFTVPLCGRVDGSLPNALYNWFREHTLYYSMGFDVALSSEVCWVQGWNT